MEHSPYIKVRLTRVNAVLASAALKKLAVSPEALTAIAKSSIALALLGQRYNSYTSVRHVGVTQHARQLLLEEQHPGRHQAPHNAGVVIEPRWCTR